jgi:putative flippase GtrA
VIQAVARQVSREFLLYAIIGLSGVLLDFLAFVLLYNLFGADEFVATFVSTTLGIVNNFVLNSALNFRTQDRPLGRFVRFYLVGAAGIVLTAAMFAVFSRRLGIDPNVVKMASMPVVLVFQYTLNKKWTFSR